MRGAVQMQVTTIGLDIAKNVFQVHGINAAEKVIVRKQLRRSQVLAFFKALPPCLIGMEACATAHYWARELTKLGHRVRLMPAKDVKAYVKRNKNDAADAEAICEAVRRPTMRFVQTKSAEQQGRLMLHRVRDLLMRQRTQVINALRAHLAELGITAAQGTAGLKELLKIIASDADERLPVDAHASLVVLAAELQAMQTLVGSLENHGAASGERGKQAAGDHPRYRFHRGDRDRGDGHGPDGIPVGARFRGLDWARAAPRFDRRQAEARADLQAGRSLFATHSRRWRSCGLALREAEPRKISLAHAASGATTLQGRGSCARQQDGAHGLGAAGPWRHLSGACACGSGVRGLAMRG